MSDSTWTVQGVSELGCWLGHFPSSWPTGRDAEDCLDAHLDCGISHVIWDLGRSIVNHHSDLPGVTRVWENRAGAELTAQQRAVMQIFEERCQLRAAINHGRQRGAVIYGRLCMNRHYSPVSIHRSQFAQDHPQWCEIGRDGWLDVSRLCYAIPEYRQERVAILREAVEIGCEGLCLDFCRQPPAVRYHPALVEGFREETGIDPRRLSATDDREGFLAWCQYRADSVTALLVELRDALDPIRQRHGRRIPVQVRIPNDGFEANLMAGFDVTHWCQETLIDEMALSELRWLNIPGQWDDAPYIELGGQSGVAVYASSSCLPVQEAGWSGQVNPAGVNPLVLARRTLRSMEAGAQGISFYQSDTAVQWPGVKEILPALSSEETLRQMVADPEMARRWPVTPENQDFGIDNHSRTSAERRFQIDGADEALGV